MEIGKTKQDLSGFAKDNILSHNNITKTLKDTYIKQTPENKITEPFTQEKTDLKDSTDSTDSTDKDNLWNMSYGFDVKNTLPGFFSVTHILWCVLTTISICMIANLVRQKITERPGIPNYVYYPMYGGIEYYKLSKNYLPDISNLSEGLSWRKILEGNGLIGIGGALTSKHHRLTKNFRNIPWKNWNEISKNLRPDDTRSAIHFLTDIKNYIIRGGVTNSDGDTLWKGGQPINRLENPRNNMFNHFMCFIAGIVFFYLGWFGIFNKNNNPVSDFDVSQLSMAIVAVGVYFMGVGTLSAWSGPKMLDDNTIFKRRTPLPQQPTPGSPVSRRVQLQRWARSITPPFGIYTPYFEQANKLIKSESRGLFGSYPHIPSNYYNKVTFQSVATLAFPFMLILFCTLWVSSSTLLANSYFDKYTYNSEGCSDTRTKEYIDKLKPEKVPAYNGDVTKNPNYNYWATMSYILWGCAVIIVLFQAKNLADRWIDKSPPLSRIPAPPAPNTTLTDRGRRAYTRARQAYTGARQLGRRAYNATTRQFRRRRTAPVSAPVPPPATAPASRIPERKPSATDIIVPSSGDVFSPLPGPLDGEIEMPPVRPPVPQPVPPPVLTPEQIQLGNAIARQRARLLANKGVPEAIELTTRRAMYGKRVSKTKNIAAKTIQKNLKYSKKIKN